MSNVSWWFNIFMITFQYCSLVILDKFKLMCLITAETVDTSAIFVGTEFLLRLTLKRKWLML